MMNLSILTGSVLPAMAMNGLAVDLTGAADVQGLLSSAMKSIHIFALSIALCILLYAVTRNYAQFGDHVGIRFIAGLLVSIVMIFAFPKVCDAIQTATENYSSGTSETIENMFCWLTEQKPNAGSSGTGEEMSIAKKIAHLPESVMHSIQAAMCNIFYVNGLWIGKFIRDMVYFLFKCLYNGAMCLAPIFFAALLIPEVRQTGVNFITSCIGLALMPLCFLFGDLCSIWLAEHMWNMLGLGQGGTFWTLVRSGAALAAPVGTILGFIAFGILYAVLAAVVYIVLPFLYMKLFKAGAPGSPAGMIAAAVGKAVHTAVVGGAILATGGTAAPAAGAASGGSAAAQTAANAAKGAAGSAEGAAVKAGQEIDKNVDLPQNSK